MIQSVQVEMTDERGKSGSAFGRVYILSTLQVAQHQKKKKKKREKIKKEKRKKKGKKH